MPQLYIKRLLINGNITQIFENNKLGNEIFVTCHITHFHSSNAQVSNTTELPFTKGQSNKLVSSWLLWKYRFSKYTYEDFVDIKSLGVDVIRVPINLHSMTQGAPDYTWIHSFLFSWIRWSIGRKNWICIFILDNHTFDPSDATDPQIGDVLNPVWLQMAQHFEGRSDKILYEILNEPHGISHNLWNSIQGDVIQTIRSVDTTHTIIVGGADYNSYNSLSKMPAYEDDNLIYTFHFYDPFVLTHPEELIWTTPSMTDLGGIPFPYEANAMPRFPTSLQGTWVQGAFNNYNNGEMPTS